MKLYETITDDVYVIAEMSANHAGSKQRAMEIVHAAHEAGADCLKIQTYTADTLTIDCHNEYFTMKEGTWKGQNYYELYSKAYTPWEWQADIKAEAQKLGMDFLSTPFDNTAVDFLEELGVEFYKIASFELVDIPLIKYVASKNKPIIMSTGMGSLEEIEEAVDTIRATGNSKLVLLKCTSAYPADYSAMNLKTIADMSQRFKVPIGLSDHSMGATAPVAAVAMGASVIEKHFCISRKVDNPDSSFSMEAVEFAEMVKAVKNARKTMGSVRYGVEPHELNDYPSRRSLFVTADIKAGEIFTPENVRSIRPAAGMHTRYYEEVLGRRATMDIAFGTPLKAEHVDGLDI